MQDAVAKAGEGGAIVLNYTPPEGLKILKAAEKLGLIDKVIWGSSTPLNDNSVAAALGAAWNGKLNVNAELSLLDDPRPEMELYRTVSAKYNPDAPLGSFQQMGFMIGRIIVKTLMDMPPADVDDPVKVNAAIKGIKNFDTHIVCKPWYFGALPAGNVPNNFDYNVVPNGTDTMVLDKDCFTIAEVEPILTAVRAAEKDQGLNSRLIGPSGLTTNTQGINLDMPGLGELWPYIVSGLAFGAMYAVTGTGLVVLYRTTGVVNLAFGAIGCMGAHVAWSLLGGSLSNPTPHAVGWRILAYPALVVVCAAHDPAVRHVDRPEACSSRSAGQVAGDGRRRPVPPRDHEGAMGHVEASCTRPAHQAVHRRRRGGDHHPDRRPGVRRPGGGRRQRVPEENCYRNGDAGNRQRSRCVVAARRAGPAGRGTGLARFRRHLRLRVPAAAAVLQQHRSRHVDLVRDRCAGRCDRRSVPIAADHVLRQPRHRRDRVRADPVRGNFQFMHDFQR